MAPSVLVVGAGMAGLTAAGVLAAAGIEVRVVDKGRAVGGRMATRRLGDAVFDHGAQHLSARTESFAAEVSRLVADGVARVWLRTASVTRPERGIEDRYAGVGGMRRIPEALAAGLDVTTGTTAERLAIDGNGIAAITGDRVIGPARAVILTPPLPQTLELLRSSAIAPAALPPGLTDIGYDATLAVMATLDAPADLPDGHLALDGPVAWMADNQHKGVSPVPALTVHSSPAFAATHLEADPASWMARLLAAAEPHHEGNIVEAVPHRWRYSQPRTTRDDGAAAVAGAPIVLAGEAFAGARVEGAHMSGLTAAHLVQDLL